MRLADYLFDRLRRLGVRHSFGIPGDFVLPLYAAQADSRIAPITVTHEPSAGFAADAYARVRGLGVALSTYGAGALNMVNAIAQAYAERSPVLVISGAPEIRGRNPDALLHHRVKNFGSQAAIYREVTAAAAVLEDASTAAEDIERVLDTVLTQKRPGYLEIPRDLATWPISPRHRSRFGARLPGRPSPSPKAQRDEAFSEIAARLGRSRRPAILAGVEVERFGLSSALRRTAERLGLPIATSIDGKAVFPEHHPQFVGTYMGKMGSREAIEVIEGADCLLVLGAYLSDTGTGLFTSRIDRASVVHASADELRIGYHCYPGITLGAVIGFLARLPASSVAASKRKSAALSEGDGDRSFTTDTVMRELSRFGAKKVSFTIDAGDCLFACARLNANVIINPGYYASMGFAVPAALGAALGAPGRHVVAVVGDGAFQMTGVELSSLVRYKVPATVVLLNNRGFSSMASLDRPRAYFEVSGWDYISVARSLGATAERVGDAPSLRRALTEALSGKGVHLIEVALEPQAVSRALRRMGEVLKARMTAKAPGRR